MSLTGVVETALAQALLFAARAQQRDMVGELARELATRRQERAVRGSAALPGPDTGFRSVNAAAPRDVKVR